MFRLYMYNYKKITSINSEASSCMYIIFVYSDPTSYFVD